MKYLKSIFALIIILLFWATSAETHAQQKPTAEQVKQIKDKLDKIKELKDKGKDDDDEEIKKLAKDAIALADSFYKIPRANLDGEPEYNPNYGGDGKSAKSGKKVKVTIGTAAFSSPGWLASTKYHEIIKHGNQAADGRWPDELTAKIIDILETEAYDGEGDEADIFGLTDAEKAENKRRRNEEHYNDLDSANRAKIDSAKKAGVPYKTAMLESTGMSKIAYSGNATLFAVGTVLSGERIQVTLRGTRIIQGMVVSAEIDGKKTETRTDANGHALLDFSAIAAGVVGTAVAVIKSFDANGKEISTANTTVQHGSSQIFNRPVIESLPDNISNNEPIAIHGQHLGAEAQVVCGNQYQETLSASDKEMTVFTDCMTGKQAVFVVTPNGVSESQMVNVYSLDFALPKNSISPKEKVQAQVHYESIPVGTKLIFTNNSPATISMSVPKGKNSANECIYTVTKENGTIPLNVTGITNGNFKIALDMSFKNDNHSPR